MLAPSALLLQVPPPVLPIDITGIIATIMGISIVLIPVIGLTARFALKPFVEALGQYLTEKETIETVKILERRVALLENQVDLLEHDVEEIGEVGRFHRELEAGRPEGSDGGGTGSESRPPGAEDVGPGEGGAGPVV